MGRRRTTAACARAAESGDGAATQRATCADAAAKSGSLRARSREGGRSNKRRGGGESATTRCCKQLRVWCTPALRCKQCACGVHQCCQQWRLWCTPALPCKQWCTPATHTGVHQPCVYTSTLVYTGVHQCWCTPANVRLVFDLHETLYRVLTSYGSFFVPKFGNDLIVQFKSIFTVYRLTHPKV